MPVQPGEEPSKHPGLVSERRCSLGEVGFCLGSMVQWPWQGQRALWGPRAKWLGLEAFSQAVPGRLLNVAPAFKQKEFLDTKEGSTWPLPGLSWHLRPEIQLVRARRQPSPSWELSCPHSGLPETCVRAPVCSLADLGPFHQI